MSAYPNYRGSAPMGRGYAPPAQGGGNYYPPQGGGPPPRHGPPGHGGYMPHSDYEASPPVMRGGPPAHLDPEPGPRGGGAFGRGYPAGGPGGYHRSPTYGGGNAPDYPRGMDPPSGSGSGFESGSNSDAPPSSSGGKDVANDCEIVVLSKAQQQYGEMVERELRNKGLKVDIMFPKGEIKIQEFLKPIAKMGTIFAIVIDPDNEHARTMNFYQFRGHIKPQYHKNVPLVMAYDLIIKKYSELKQKEIGLVPEPMKALLEKLLNEQTLRDNDYVALVRFLQERRKRQNAFMNRTSNVIQETKTDVQSLIDTAEGRELQKRILSIVNDNAD